MLFSMDKDWSFHLGDVQTHLGKSHGDIYGTSKAGGAAGVPQGSFDVRGWEVVQLPHDWSVIQPFEEDGAPSWGYKPRGVAWYRKCFLIPQEYEGRQLRLCFDGVATHCTVYLNGSVLKRNFTGYAPFSMDITERVWFGSTPNTLAVFVDATNWEGWWYEGAGIYRHVWLQVLEKQHIDEYGIFVKPVKQEDKRWRVEIQTTLCNDDYEKTNEYLYLSQRIADAEGTIVAEAEEVSLLLSARGKVGIAQEVSVDNPMLWDVDSPNLYRLTTKLFKKQGEQEIVLEEQTTNFGFRSFFIDPKKGFFLNGKPCKLLGTCNHQDHGGIGVAVSDSVIEFRIRRLKEMGSNAYRCAHGMPSNELLDACDRLGMIVMDENRNFETGEDGIEQLRTMVKRDRNHPSVIFYSLFNEEPLQDTSAGKRMVKRMNYEVKQLDDTRLVTGAMNGGVLNGDGAISEVDVGGVNYQIYAFDRFHEAFPDKPVLGSENCSAFSVRDCYQTDSEKHVFNCYDENPADWGQTLRDTWECVLERDFVAGAFIWTGFDYLGEPSPHVWPSVSSFFGLMDICGFEKDAFYLCKAWFEEEPIIHVLPHWNWVGHEGELVKVMTHTNCEEAELFVNGISVGRKSVPRYEQAYWEVPYEAGEIVLVGYHDGREVGRDIRRTTGKAVRLLLKPYRDKIVLGDAIPVNIIAVDADGNEVPDCEELLSFQVEHGRLAGSANGDPNCHELFDAPFRSLFHGKCQVILAGEAGRDHILLTVTADEKSGIETAKMSLPVLPRQGVPFVESVKEQYLLDWRITPVLFEMRPDPMKKLSQFDMNSWEPIRVENNAPRIFQNQKGKYGMYRTKAIIPGSINGHIPVLHFHSIWGRCEVYMNGIKIGTCDYEWSAPFDVELTVEHEQEAEITVIVQANNFGAGICDSVVIR